MNDTFNNQLFFLIKALFYKQVAATESTAEFNGLTVSELTNYLQDTYKSFSKQKVITSDNKDMYKNVLCASEETYTEILKTLFPALEFQLFMLSQIADDVYFKLNNGIFKEFIYYSIDKNKEIDESKLNQLIGRVVEIATQ